MQHLNQGMLGNGAPYEGTQEELLRHVGCARLRAAMLNKAMQQVRRGDSWRREGDSCCMGVRWCGIRECCRSEGVN
jgi:hypothetical protein